MGEQASFEWGEDVAGAVLSDCGTYRYRLWRHWDWGEEPGMRVCWIMLNPSTADARADDPTVRRCVGFTQRWGYGGMEVVNLYPQRTTDPDRLGADGIDPYGEGERNRNSVAAAGLTSDLVVVAWGARAPRSPAMTRTLRDLRSMRLMCLGRTKSGAPRHPLYVRGDTELQVWREPWMDA